MILKASLTLYREIVFPGGGGSGRSPFESAAPGEGLRGVLVRRAVSYTHLTLPTICSV